MKTLLAGAVLLSACGSATTAGQGSAPFVASSISGGDTTPLGSVDGEPITRKDLPREASERLLELENELEQRRFHMLWAGVESVVAERLLQKEAKRRNVSVEELRKSEIDDKLTPPSDEEVRRLYDENKEVIGASFEAAAPHIKSELSSERKTQLERTLIESLRQGANVAYTLPAPNLPRVALEIGKAPALGPDDARVTLVEYSDFQCPYCARAKSLLHKLHELYPNDLRIVFRHFPLAQHPQARGAAEASHCAFEQDKFWPFHDLLFDNSQALAAADLKRWAQDAKLDVPAFEACLSSPRPSQAVRQNEEEGRKVGVEGTPAIYINGMKLIGLLPLPLMQSLIDRELGR
jgi:protein-disulfide isomerase